MASIDGNCGSTTYSYTSVADALLVTNSQVVIGGIIAKQDITDDVWDSANNRLRDAGAYVELVRAGGTTYIKAHTDDLATQRQNDLAMMAGLKAEYCYYLKRYQATLNKLYTNITQQTPPQDTQQVLTATITLNRRVNALVEVMDFIANQRIININARKAGIDRTNAEISGQLPSLQETANSLTSNNLIINSQKEMIRYTQEKNNHIGNQISLWAGLNIVAIATIFYVYRKM